MFNIDSEILFIIFWIFYSIFILIQLFKKKIFLALLKESLTVTKEEKE